MDFGWTADQKKQREEVIRFAQGLNDDVVRRDAEHEFATEAWKRCADFGIQAMPVPAAYGGSDSDASTIALVMEGLGYGCRDGGLVFSLNAQMWSCEIPLVRFGNEELKRRFLPGLCDGSRIGVQAMTEPHSGSDAFSMATTAVKSAEGYVLNGTKTFITSAPIADVFIVFAATDPTMGFAGLSAFVVDRHAPGVSVDKPFRKMGLRTAQMSQLVFRDCLVPEDHLLGRVGAGMAIFNTSMDWERSFILASAVGTMERQLERTIAYARDRKIGKYQAVSHRIVDMKLRLETSRLLLYQLAWLRGKGKPTPLESAMVKLHLSENFVSSSLDALQMHGAYGYMEEFELERDVRDAIGSRIYSGTSEILKNIIAGHLGL